MNSDEFKHQMGLTAVKFRDDYDKLTLAAYWEDFQTWKLEEFVAAMHRCENELDRFPTVRQIIDRRYQLKESNVWDDSGRVECVACQDRKGLEVYDPRCYQLAHDKRLTIENIRTLMVLCSCVKVEPDEQRKKNSLRPLIAFDALQMKRCEALLPAEQVQELLTYRETVWKPRNHYDEFSDWQTKN